ncbi:hypothetical protein ACFJGV_12505 [Cnuibacter sp. UC19_7]|uniref:hypothetical protein n=1 Tax=Cnuibacter sp. UC19_7 TaxID=3350166 RepID=UPI0036711BD7
MTSTRPSALALAWSGAVIAAAILAGCSSPSSDQSAASPAGTAAPTPTPSAATAAPNTTAAGDYTAFCKANSAAAAAKAGTVGEDIEAVNGQLDAIRALLPLQGVSAEVAAGAQVFEASAVEDLSILAQFPSDSLVSDVGLDPRFLESDAIRNAASDPDYRAFIAWTIQTCGLGG